VSLSSEKVTKDDFAAKMSSTFGIKASSHEIDLVYKLFDLSRDGKLDCREMPPDQ
jgi:Ca2+-binding EF-hand superfamily protein